MEMNGGKYIISLSEKLEEKIKKVKRNNLRFQEVLQMYF